ncbi:hypothetical protein RN001_003432 [Aquatica leii]|uniref:Kinase n=1 Tax=Aquatica leii TaxID=1421715 RepID=A0AAN7SDZ5_9COLE|nr:hypothetical protein RN001_003432 [Aquatica leii]
MYFKRNIVILKPYFASEDEWLASNSDETPVESALSTSAFTSTSSSLELVEINAIEDKEASTAEEKQQKRPDVSSAKLSKNEDSLKELTTAKELYPRRAQAFFDNMKHKKDNPKEDELFYVPVWGVYDFCLILMECFSVLWSRRLEEGKVASPWIIGGEDYIQLKNSKNSIPLPGESYRGYVNKIVRTDSSASVNSVHYKRFKRNLSFNSICEAEESERIYKNAMHGNNINQGNGDLKMITEDEIKHLIQVKAEKHREYYRKLRGDDRDRGNTGQMAKPVTHKEISTVEYISDSETFNPPAATTSLPDPDPHLLNEGSQTISNQRHRRIGVFELEKEFVEEIGFVSVKKLRENYLAMLEENNKKFNTDEKHRKCMFDKSYSTDSQGVDETFLAPPPSGYCSSSASAGSDDEKEKSWFKYPELHRSASSDSALGLNQSDEEVTDNSPTFDKKEYKDESIHYPFIRSPYSPRGSVDHINVPSKTLIESKFVPYPLDRKSSICGSEGTDGYDDKNASDSRRPSCFTDDGEEPPRFRFWRTPSIVVSDYSDDVVGLTLEDIEFFRNQRKETSSSPDSSVHSSCSNLNYCGSTISNLDTEYILRTPFRKISDCSTCSTFSGDEDTEVSCQPTKERIKPSGWRKLRNIVQWTPFFQIYKKQRYPWVQLAGHQGNFKAGPDQGTILKKLSVKEEKCFKMLMNDVLRPYVPEYKGQIASDDGECSYIQLQDLLGDFNSPCVMDCKIGVRTYLEEELAKAKENPKLRKDMYEKMIQIDSDAPTEEEHRLKAVTKPRYMVWRETISSTATLGFRIEGIRKSDGSSTKDFKTTKSKEQVLKAFADFTDTFPHCIPKYIQRLKAIKTTLETSEFFRTHELIGSSLLFVHDQFSANVWLIDFAKTLLLPEEITIDHNSYWKVGNHEDGYLIGINNIISIFVTLLEKQRICVTPPLNLTEPSDSNESNEEQSKALNS